MKLNSMFEKSMLEAAAAVLSRTHLFLSGIPQLVDIRVHDDQGKSKKIWPETKWLVVRLSCSEINCELLLWNGQFDLLSWRLQAWEFETKRKKKKAEFYMPKGLGSLQGLLRFEVVGVGGGGGGEGANPLAKNEIWKFWNFLESGLSGPRMVSLCTLFEWLHYDTVSISMSPCNGELWVQKYGHICWENRAQSSLPLKPQIGQYIAIHAMLTARFSKPLEFFLCWLWLTLVPV